MAEERTVEEIISSSKMDEETADRVIEDYNAGDLSIESVKTAAEVSDICNDPYIMHEVVSRLEDGFSKDQIMKASNEFELANDEDEFLQDIASDRIQGLYSAISNGITDEQIDFLEGKDREHDPDDLLRSAMPDFFLKFSHGFENGLELDDAKEIIQTFTSDDDITRQINEKVEQIRQKRINQTLDTVKEGVKSIKDSKIRDFYVQMAEMNAEESKYNYYGDQDSTDAKAFYVKKDDLSREFADYITKKTDSMSKDELKTFREENNLNMYYINTSEIESQYQADYYDKIKVILPGDERTEFTILPPLLEREKRFGLETAMTRLDYAADISPYYYDRVEAYDIGIEPEDYEEDEDRVYYANPIEGFLAASNIDLSIIKDSDSKTFRDALNSAIKFDEFINNRECDITDYEEYDSVKLDNGKYFTIIGDDASETAFLNMAVSKENKVKIYERIVEREKEAQKSQTSREALVKALVNARDEVKAQEKGTEQTKGEEPKTFLGDIERVHKEMGVKDNIASMSKAREDKNKEDKVDPNDD